MTRDEILNRLVANPLFRQYAECSRREGFSNCEPWHVLGERLNAAGQCALAAGEEKVAISGINFPVDHREKLLLTVAEAILGATPFLWSDFTEQLANAAPLPKHVVSPTVLPSPRMFWAREGLYRVIQHEAEPGKPKDFSNSWIAVCHDKNGVFVITNCDEMNDENEPPEGLGLEFSQIPYGSCWPKDFEKGEAWEMKAVAKVLKMCAFLSSPYVNKDKTRLARHHRRQLERAGEPRETIEEPVHVVKLRREVKEPAKKPGANGETASIEWQHQWWVSGHYRAQWYPHEEAHRVIWIAPYMKGPRDKPILEKVYAVVR